jgi:hypothetical protein
MGKEVLPRRQFIESNSDKIDIDNLWEKWIMILDK